MTLSKEVEKIVGNHTRSYMTRTDLLASQILV